MQVDGAEGGDGALTSPPSSRSLSAASSPSSHVPHSPDDAPQPLPSTSASPQDNTTTPPPPSAPPLTSIPDNYDPPPQPDPLSGADNDASSTAGNGATPASKAKVVKQRRRRSPSFSPSPPPPPPPLSTIRLDIALGGPDNYEVNVRQLTKDTGQRPATPPSAVRQYISESESSEDEGAGAKRRRKKKTLTSEYYDVNDPFIDDSELALDQRTYFAQTKQQGFYVSSGEVALLKDKSAPPKSKAKRVHLPPPEPIAGPSNFPGAHQQQHTMLGRPKPTAPTSLSTHAQAQGHSNKSPESVMVENGVGTRDAPIAIVSDGDEPTSASGPKRKSDAHLSGSAGAKKRRKVDLDAFHPELRAALHELRLAKEKENWDVKGKFPPAIKPLLTEVAVKAIKLSQYDDNFFSFMPELFPYNRFTMSKLIKRLVFTDHMTLLIKRQDEILKELKQLVDEAFPKVREDHEKAHLAWQQKMEKLGLPTDPATAQHSAESTPIPPVEGADGDMSIEMYKPKEDHVPGPPQQRFKLSERMKGLIWNLVCLSNECCRIENEKSTLEGNSAQVSEQGLRKVLYQKIVAVFPDGWMNSGQISRDVSVIKKKLEKEAMDVDQ